ncbi:transcriptional regulator [Bordetella trematum]|uniref:Transcriptional regulator n=1 Tax=Bordetella trematum TaxID=123899 RepID=A0A157R1Z4_9BORD|nr:AlpA family phage regulatory protein [Bordetella trematum]SAI51886.1 transcriptional regulator [Bordetella trematum]SAI73390.1 transcriptional regulator [Bordetella trematum]SUV97359.1 transcriptional regulator [Bordetella trematum]
MLNEHDVGKPAPAFYRLADVVRITALSRATIYRRIAEGRFPRPVHLGGRACGWTTAALQAWIDNPQEYKAALPAAAKPLRRRRNTDRLKLSRFSRRKFRTQFGHEGARSRKELSG